MKTYLNPEMIVELIENEDILTVSVGIQNLTELDLEENFVEKQ